MNLGDVQIGERGYYSLQQNPEYLKAVNGKTKKMICIKYYDNITPYGPFSAVALIIADGNGLGSSMTYVSGLSKLVKAIVGDCSAAWNGDGTVLTIKSTNWNKITVISADQYDLSVA